MFSFTYTATYGAMSNNLIHMRLIDVKMLGTFIQETFLRTLSRVDCAAVGSDEPIKLIAFFPSELLR